jgi:protein-disulfide isomerase
VRFVFRHLPFIGDESFQAAEASECADEQGAFWEYHDKLFVEWKGENVGAYSDENLVRFADDLGLDTTTFEECLDSGKYEDKVSEQRDRGGDIGVKSTPTVFVDGERVNAQYADVQAAIEGGLSAGG